MDHDQRFKTLIREFFSEFLRLFFVVWAARFDLAHVEWLEKEVLPNPPEGSQHLLDLAAKLHSKQSISDDNENMLALIRIEIEAPDRTTRLTPRMPSYYVHLRDTYQLPVLPIVIYLKVGYEGIGVDIVTERFWELEVLKFSYLYVGLPGLDGLEYMKGENYLGVALSALMRIPPGKIAELGAEAFRRISQSPLTQQQKYLLADCVNAYLVLEEPQKKIFEQLMQGEHMAEVRAMKKSLHDWSVEQGRCEARLETSLKMVLRLGTKRFGSPSNDQDSRLRAIQDSSRMEDLAERVLDVQSWDELLQTVSVP